MTLLRRLLARLLWWAIHQLEQAAFELEPCPVIRVPELVPEPPAGPCSACGVFTAGSCDDLSCPFFCCPHAACLATHRRLFHDGEEQPPPL